MPSLASLATLPSLPRVSVVIPSLNEERYIGALLDSIEAQDYPLDRIEVLVADGGSSDATREIVASRAAHTSLAALRLVDNPGRSTAAGLNAGAAAATGEVIAIVGAHAELDPGFVSNNVRALEESGAAATGGPIETIGDGPVASAIAAAMSHPFGVGDAKFRYASESGDVDTIAFAAYRREVFDELGGFDLEKDKGEDDDFNYRLRKAGGRLFLTPSVRSRYYSRASFPGLWKQYLGYGGAKGRAFVDDPAALGPRHFVPLAAVLGGAFLLFAVVILRRLIRLATLGLAAYGALALVSGRSAASKSNADWRLTSLAFPVIHASYGIGMAIGIFKRWRQTRDR